MSRGEKGGRKRDVWESHREQSKQVRINGIGTSFLFRCVFRADAVVRDLKNAVASQREHLLGRALTYKTRISEECQTMSARGYQFSVNCSSSCRTMCIHVHIYSHYCDCKREIIWQSLAGLVFML